MGIEGAPEVERHLAARADRPFGDIELASGRALQPYSIAGQRAASNLLTKAVRALDRGDTARAHAYVERATRLPFDPHEDTHPAAAEVAMMLFCLVTDTLEDTVEGDSRWLDAARIALSPADDVGRGALREVLVDVDSDYELPRAERSALRAILADVPQQPELRDFRTEEATELGTVVISVLGACRSYAAATQELGIDVEAPSR